MPNEGDVELFGLLCRHSIYLMQLTGRGLLEPLRILLSLKISQTTLRRRRIAVKVKACVSGAGSFMKGSLGKKKKENEEECACYLGADQSEEIEMYIFATS